MKWDTDSFIEFVFFFNFVQINVDIFKRLKQWTFCQNHKEITLFCENRDQPIYLKKIESQFKNLNSK